MCPQRPSYRQKAAAIARQLMMSIGHAVMPVVHFEPVPVKIRKYMIASALMPTVVLGLVCGAPVDAHANQPQKGIVLASFATTTPNDRATINLFGAAEQRYTDISAFTKWTGVLARFKKDFQNSMDQPAVREWMAFLSGLKGKSKAEQIDAVNAYMNRMPFVADQNNYGASDYWATPMEFFARGGDCEDYAVAKYLSLRALGFSEDEMRLAIVYDNEMRMPHALLVVYHKNDAHILDNQASDVRVSSGIKRYKPIYSISQVAWWRH